MGDASKYKVSVDELEATAHVDQEDLIESVDVQDEPPPDPRGELPDRDWFASGA